MKRSTVGFLMTGAILLFVMLFVVGVGLGLRAWEQSHRVKDTPETKSAFLKNYNPKNAVEPFLCGQYLSLGGGGGVGADTKSIQHTADFMVAFSMVPDKKLALMTALNEDVNNQLIHNGAQILSRTGDLASGFHYAYRLGKATRTVMIPPVRLMGPTGLLDRQAGRVGIDARVELNETWFPKEEAAIQASLKPVQ